MTKDMKTLKRMADFYTNFEAIPAKYKIPHDQVALSLFSCHSKCELDLEAIEDAIDTAQADKKSWRNFDLLHDVVGICNHVDMENGGVDGRFLPRFAKCQ